MKETITVIVPVYNVEPYLDRCVKSILDQTYPYLQVILIDDGSTDASGDICDSLAQGDSRVQVIHKTNGGPMSARKAGLAEAKGAYVGFVDGDDYIAPNMYEELLVALIATNSDFVQTGYIMESQTQHVKSVIAAREDMIFDDFNKCDIISKYLLGHEDVGMIITSTLWSKLYKRQMIVACCEKVPDDVFFGEDLLAICHCIFASSRFSMKQGTYYHYRIREDSLSDRDGDTRIFVQLGDMYRHLCDVFQQYGCLGRLRSSQDRCLIRCMLEYLIPIGKKRGILHAPSYCYPNTEELSGKRIVIYGAGYVGQDYYAQICKQPSCEIVALADTYPKECCLEHIKVQGLYDLNTLKFDVILIAVLDRNVMMEIRDSLIDIGVPSHKITWEKPELVVQ